MLYKPDWEKSKQRFEALWENEIIDRCCISVMAPKDGGEPYEPYPEKYEDQIKYWTDPEWILRRNIRMMENTFYGGDAIPMINTAIGPCAHAAFFGCEYSFKENTVWFEEAIKDWDTDELKFDPKNKLYLQFKKNLQYLSKEGKGKFFVAMPDHTSSIDALAHIRGSENVLTDLFLEPENVKAALKTITDVWIDTNNDYYGYTQPCNDGGSCVGWLNTWAPGRHSQLQCDISVMISPEFFEEFVMEELTRAADSMDYPIYHFDGVEQIRHLDMLLSIKNLKMIQWTQVAGQPSITENIPVLQKIQAAGKGLLINSWDMPKIRTLIDNLSPKGLYIVTYLQNESDARDLLKIVEKFR